MSLRDVQGSKFNAPAARFKAATQRFKGLSADLISEGFRGCKANGIEWRTCHNNGLASFSKRLQAIGEQHCPLVIHTTERVIDDDCFGNGCLYAPNGLLVAEFTGHLYVDCFRKCNA